MKTSRQLAVRMGAAIGIAMLAATSAFAEPRPWRETRDRAEQRRSIQRERAREDRRGDNPRNRIESRQRRDDRSYRDNRRNDRSSRDNRSYRNNRQPYYAQGRITNVRRHGSGYRVWVHGARHPFFIPASHWRRDRFRVGLVINLGGYYNRGGYYDYYDGRGYSRAELRGVVETVDYRRDTFVVRNDATGSFVTVVNRDRRRDVRPGDYVEVYGDWSRSGVLQAYDVDLLDNGYYRR